MRFWQRIHPPTRPAASGDAPAIGSTQLAELSTVFAAPRWLRDLGRTAWLLVGVMLLLAGLTWLLGATYTIGGPWSRRGSWRPSPRRWSERFSDTASLVQSARCSFSC